MILLKKMEMPHIFSGDLALNIILQFKPEEIDTLTGLYSVNKEIKDILDNKHTLKPVSYTHLTLPTTPYV